MISFSGIATEPAHFKRISYQQGLSSNYVNNLVQRQDGFVWLATAGGLSRFDGYSFVNFNSVQSDPTSLPDDWVNCLLEDTSGKLWVGTEKGLAVLQENQREFRQFLPDKNLSSSISGRQIRNIFEDQKGRLWIASNKGLSLFLPETKSFANFSIETLPPYERGINFILQSEADSLWVGTDKGLFLFDISNSNFEQHSVTHENGIRRVVDGALSSNKDLWLALGENGVARYNLIEKKIKHYSTHENNDNSLSSNNIWTIEVDSSGVVWAGSWGGGLNKIIPESNRIERYRYDKRNENSIPNNSITDIMQDQSGNIWIATYEGLALYQPDRAVEIRNSNQQQDYRLSADFAWAMEEVDDSIWIGTTEGLNQWSKQSNKIFHYYAGKEKDKPKEVATIWAIKKGTENQLWLGTEFGLALFDTITKKLYYLHDILTNKQLSESHQKILKSSVWSIKVNHDNTVWVGTNTHHLYLLHQDKGILKDYTSLIYQSVGENSNIEITGITEDLEHNLWLSTTTGLLFLDTQNHTIKKITSSDGSQLLANDWIYAMVPHKQNEHNRQALYWVSSQNSGLSLISLQPDGKITRLKHINDDYQNFGNSSVYSVDQVDSQNLWFTDSTNLYHYDIASDKVTNFGKRFFLSNTVFHENTQLSDSNGFIYFASSRGLVKFHPDKITPFNHKAKIYFTSISSNTLDLSVGNNRPDTSLFSSASDHNESIYTPPFNQSNIQFSYENVMFKFEFSALDYEQSENINYSYRLQGFRDQWQNLGEKREVAFTNLEPGDYLLEVNANIGTYKVNNEPLLLKFNVERKPWLTGWAFLGYALLCSVPLSFLYKFWSQKLLAQHQLDHSQLKLSQALWGSGDELWEWNIKSNFLHRTNQLSSLKHRTPHFNGKFNLNEIGIHPDDVKLLEDKFEDIIQGRTNELEAMYRQKDRNNKWVWLLDKAKVIKWDNQGTPSIVSGTCRNINKLKESEDKNRLIASAFQSSSDGAIVLDKSLRVLSVNDSFCEITGLKKELPGSKLRPKDYVFETLPEVKSTNVAKTITFKEIKNEVIKNKNFKKEVLFITRERRKLPIVLKVSSVLDINGIISHFVIMITDITYRLEAERKLQKMASLDALTGLPNRAFLLQLLEQGLLRSKRNSSLMAVLFIDLDHFKNVNDSLGHNIGDALLVAISHKLTGCVRESDSVARLGGDEFTIALFELSTIGDILNVAEKILEELSKPIKLRHHELVISPSIGIAIYPDDGKSVEELLQHADTAMYHAKRNGRNNFQFFAESMNQIVLNRVELESSLRRAIKEEQFELYYQPKYSLKTQTICGFEALIRWNNPHEGIISPDDFIPIAEETGLILPIGEWVLRQACEQLREWSEQGYSNYHLAINISALQFMDRGLISKITHTLSEYGIAPDRLEIELTESTLIDNIDYTKLTLMGLRQLGVKLSLDDFGTGYSSLSYLRQLPIDYLKIDRSFVKHMVEDQRNAKMVESIVLLAHNIGVSVVAEGIESKEQLEMFSQFQAEQIQGYLLCKPVNVATANILLSQKNTINQALDIKQLLSQLN